jgi:hypothetical protein
MLSFFSDIILLILPLLNAIWLLIAVIVLVFNMSNLKKSLLRGMMIISSITIPFILLIQLTPPDEGVSVFSEFLYTAMLNYSLSLFAFSFCAGLIAVLRLHVYGGKSNAPSKASGRIHQFNFRDFFRRRWRLLFYGCAIGIWVMTIYMVSFYFENWPDFHPVTGE